MAGEIGHVRERVRKSGERYFYVDCRPHGRVFSIPDPGGSMPIPIRDRRTAERVLEAVRKAYADHGSMARALAPWQTRPSEELLIDRKLEVWLTYWKELVAQGKRSVNSLREPLRLVRPDGHFAFWRGRSILEIKTALVEDYALWLGTRGISHKTQRDTLVWFRSFHRWLLRRGELDGQERVYWPTIEVAEHAPRTASLEEQGRVIEAIPWERRGAFLVAATESLRLSEVRAFNVDHYLGGGKLLLASAIQGQGKAARVGPTKNRTASVRTLWNPELIRWIEWRLERVTAESKLRGESALFWNPDAKAPSKRWEPSVLRKEWHRACEGAGVGRISFQEGTRHSTLTALGEALPERVLRAYSRHRSAKSLDHYSKPRATPEAIVRALQRDDTRR
jgi:hypothetical protein